MNSDVYFHHVFVLFKDKAGILMKQNKNGFTLMEMLIVIAIIAVLIAVAIPVGFFTGALCRLCIRAFEKAGVMV